MRHIMHDCPQCCSGRRIDVGILLRGDAPRLSTASATPPTSAANFRSFRSSAPRLTPSLSLADNIVTDPCHSEPGAKPGEEPAVLPDATPYPSARNDKASVPPVVKDLDLSRDLAKAARRLAEIHVHNGQQPDIP